MANDTTSPTRPTLRRRSAVSCHRLVGAGVTALVFFTPTPFDTAAADEHPPEPETRLAGLPIGAQPAVGPQPTATTSTSGPTTAGSASTRPGTTSPSPTTTPSATGADGSGESVLRSSSQATGRVPTTTEPAAQVLESDMPTSPDVGEVCASGLDSDDLDEFMRNGIADIGGADYQRATRLPDDRVLWTFQDAFVRGRLVHNVAVIQSGRCFTRLGPHDRSWLFADATQRMQRWHWILDGVVAADGMTIDLFVVEMHETGDRYLGRTRPRALRRVSIDVNTLEVVATVDEPWIDDRLYGWSVTSDADHTYLYSHCYQQFGHDTLLGFAECSSEITVARVDRGEPGGVRTYWDGRAWNPEPASAVPVVDATLFFAGNNPAQIRFAGERFELVEKRGDWFGETVEFATAPDPFGPFEPAASVAQPLPCSSDTCNSYFATWVPWHASDGTAIWMISHNRWDGAETADHLEHYRPSVHTIRLPR